MRGAARACDVDEEGPKQRIGEPFIIVERTDWIRYFSFGVACSFMMDIVHKFKVNSNWTLMYTYSVNFKLTKLH